MKVFVTGATGYIGGALVRALLAAGHDVVGLVREKATPAVPVRGDLGDPATYERAAAECDAIVHTAFEYSASGREKDRRATEALLRVARGTFIYTSGIWVLGPTGATGGSTGVLEAADETTPVNPAALVSWRPAHEQLVLDAHRGPVATAVVRPGIVVGGRGGLLEGFFAGERFVGTGANRWPTVHRDDLADLYVRVIEARLRRDEGRIFHGTDGSRDRVADIARAVARAAAAPEPGAWPLEEARAKLGPFADALAQDQVIESRRSAERLGWRPRIRGAVRNAVLLARERAG